MVHPGTILRQWLPVTGVFPCRTRPLGSAPVGMEWDDSASIDDFIMAKHRALTMPAQHESSRTDFAAAGIQTGVNSLPHETG